MTLDDAKEIAEIVNLLATPATMIAVAVMQIVSLINVKRVEKATNSLMASQRVADHAAGVLEERERIKSQ